MTVRHQGALPRRATSGPPLYIYSAIPDSKPKAAIGLIHGYADHGARYLRVMDAWSQRGIASIAIDLRGHGRAGGKRGHCLHFGEFLDDTLELERLVVERGSPAFLFGHSFGGVVAVSSVISRPTPWRALVLSAPFFGLGVSLQISPLKRMAGAVASRLLPGLALPNGIRSADVTHDAALAAAYDKDPLVFHVATARWFSETTRAQEVALASAASLTTPLYVVMGTADRLSKYEQARAFFDQVGARDKTWVACEGLFHEVLNEPEWPGIADGIADFILARAAQR